MRSPNNETPGETAVTETPEFKAAVEKAVADAVGATMAQLSAAREQAGTPGSSDDHAVMKALALEIAKISGQNTGQTYVDPVEMERREVATKALRALLIELRASGEMPAYKLVGKVQLPVGQAGPTLIEPLYRDRAKVQRATELDYPLVPNLAMRPINESGERVFNLFLTAIGHKINLDEVEDDDIGFTFTATDEYGNRIMQPMRGSASTGAMALNAQGAVVRGAAADAILRNDPAVRNHAPAGTAAANAATATIRRHGDGERRLVKVLGGMAPVEVG